MRFDPRIWLARHLQVALSTLGRLSRSPISSLMTSTVIGITLALPTGLYLVLTNLEQLAGGWESGASFSLFLKTDTPEQRVADLARSLSLREDVIRVRIISREAAMEEFRQLSGFGEALDILEENPLPPVLILYPMPAAAEPAAAERLRDELRQLPEVEIARIDLQWLYRFQTITEIAQRGLLVIAGLLGVTVLLVVGNTIRLEIENRRAEIEITRLVGATSAFIRRPFLYSGFWYGLGGGGIAWLLVSGAFALLQTPVEHLAALYQTGFDLSRVSLPVGLTLLAVSALLGLAGSWVAVGRHLSAMEPD